MDTYDAKDYGETWAPVYDEVHAHLWGKPAEQAAEALAKLAGGGPALELGIGTGRIALPLISRGVEVHGVDASPAMVDRLRARPGGDRIDVTIGNFMDVPVDGTFSLIFVVFNTFFALTTQQAQVQCFVNVARHLTEGGVFVIEAFVPDVTRFVDRQALRTSGVDAQEVVLEAAQHDPVEQTVRSQLVLLREAGITLLPIPLLRYAWPSELDLMARLAGLRLRARWEDWEGRPFSSRSRFHISIYEKVTG